MHRYHLDLVDTDHVTDAGGALLDDDKQARKVALELVQEVRATRPELIGRGYEIVARADNGGEVWRVATAPFTGGPDRPSSAGRTVPKGLWRLTSREKVT